MKAIDRLVIFLLALFLAAAGVALIYAVLCQSAVAPMINAAIAESPYRWITLIVGGILIILALMALVGSAFRRSASKVTTLTAVTENGGVELSVQAVEQVIRKSASSIIGVSNIETGISDSADGVKIKLKAKITGDNIPATANNLQSAVKGQLEAMTGLKVAQVQVVVVEVEPLNNPVASPVSSSINTTTNSTDL